MTTKMTFGEFSEQTTLESHKRRRKEKAVPSNSIRLVEVSLRMKQTMRMS